VIQISH